MYVYLHISINEKTKIMKNLITMTKEKLREELKNGFTLEFSNENDLIETWFSSIRGKFMIRKNGELIKSTESFTNLYISLGLHNLNLTDKY